MTKTLKSTFVALVLAIFAFLPFMFAGCNEEEIEGYKAQISELQAQVAQTQAQNSTLEQQNSGLQTQNTQLQNQNTQLQGQNTQLQNQNSELQEQVNLIHTPTAEERKAYNIVGKAIDALQATSNSDELSVAYEIENFLTQFWGIELNKVLYLTGTINNSPFGSKVQIVINSNSIELKADIRAMVGEGMFTDPISYASYTINFDENTNDVISIIGESITNMSNVVIDPTIKVYLFTASTSTSTQTEYTEGEIFEAILQKAQNFVNLETNVDADFIIIPQE